MLNNFHALTIVETASAKQEIDKLNKQYNRFVDGFDGIKWRLARDPEKSGFKIDGSQYYIFKTDDWTDFADLPPIVVLYSFDNDEVLIHGVKVCHNSR